MLRQKDIQVLFSAEEIHERVVILAREIKEKMPEDVMLVSLLKGSFMFTADLVRELYRLNFHPQIDFMTLSSYGVTTQSSKKITVNRDLAEEVKDRNILLIDDILESGRTLSFARNLIVERGAASVKICVLLEKPGKRDITIDADFRGFLIPDKFVVGYGLDYANFYRELPYVGTIDIH